MSVVTIDASEEVDSEMPPPETLTQFQADRAARGGGGPIDPDRCTSDRKVKNRYKKAELVAEAKKKGLEGAARKKIDDLCDFLKQEDVASLPSEGDLIDKPAFLEGIVDLKQDSAREAVRESFEDMRGVGYSNQCITPCFPADSDHPGPWCKTEPYKYWGWTFDWDYCVPPVVLETNLGISANPTKPCAGVCEHKPVTEGYQWTLGNVVGAAGSIALGGIAASMGGKAFRDLVLAAQEAMRIGNVLEFLGVYGETGAQALMFAVQMAGAGIGGKLGALAGSAPGVLIKTLSGDGEERTSCSVESGRNWCLSPAQVVQMFMAFAEKELENATELSTPQAMQEFVQDVRFGLSQASPKALETLADTATVLRSALDDMSKFALRAQAAQPNAETVQVVGRVFLRLVREFSELVRAATSFYRNMDQTASHAAFRRAKARWETKIRPETEAETIPQDDSKSPPSWFGSVMAQFTQLFGQIQQFQTRSDFRLAMLGVAVYTAATQLDNQQIFRDFSGEVRDSVPRWIADDPAARAIGLDRLYQVFTAVMARGPFKSLLFVLTSVCVGVLQNPSLAWIEQTADASGLYSSVRAVFDKSRKQWRLAIERLPFWGSLPEAAQKGLVWIAMLPIDAAEQVVRGSIQKFILGACTAWQAQSMPDSRGLVLYQGPTSGSESASAPAPPSLLDVEGVDASEPLTSSQIDAAVKVLPPPAVVLPALPAPEPKALVPIEDAQTTAAQIQDVDTIGEFLPQPPREIVVFQPPERPRPVVRLIGKPVRAAAAARSSGVVRADASAEPSIIPVVVKTLRAIWGAADSKIKRTVGFGLNEIVGRFAAPAVSEQLDQAAQASAIGHEARKMLGQAGISVWFGEKKIEEPATLQEAMTGMVLRGQPAAAAALGTAMTSQPVDQDTAARMLVATSRNFEQLSREDGSSMAMVFSSVLMEEASVAIRELSRTSKTNKLGELMAANIRAVPSSPQTLEEFSMIRASLQAGLNSAVGGYRATSIPVEQGKAAEQALSVVVSLKALRDQATSRLEETKQDERALVVLPFDHPSGSALKQTSESLSIVVTELNRALENLAGKDGLQSALIGDGSVTDVISNDAAQVQLYSRAQDFYLDDGLQLLGLLKDTSSVGPETSQKLEILIVKAGLDF